MNNLHQELAQELIAMRIEDQRMRNSGVFDTEVDVKNTERMKEIVEHGGWPTISKVGEEAADAAWILVQHADEDLSFQEKCLELMKAQPKGEIRKRNIALLEDRVRVSKGMPQLYGTQFYKGPGGEYIRRPIEDEEHVVERRLEVGLRTLEEEEATMNGKERK